MSKSGRSSTQVKVIIHRLTDGRVMVAILESQWRGMVRLDRRYTAAREVLGVNVAPAGVDLSVWQAHQALGDLMEEQHDAWRARAQ